MLTNEPYCKVLPFSYYCVTSAETKQYLNIGSAHQLLDTANNKANICKSQIMSHHVWLVFCW